MQARAISYNEVTSSSYNEVTSSSYNEVTSSSMEVEDAGTLTAESSEANVLSRMTDEDERQNRIRTSPRLSSVSLSAASCEKIINIVLLRYKKISKLASIIAIVCMYLILIVSACAMFCPSWEYFKTEFIYSSSFICLTSILGALAFLSILGFASSIISNKNKLLDNELDLMLLERQALNDKSVSELKNFDVFVIFTLDLADIMGISFAILGVIWGFAMPSSLKGVSAVFSVLAVFCFLVQFLAKIYNNSLINHSIETSFDGWAVTDFSQCISSIHYDPPLYFNSSPEDQLPPSYESLYNNGDIHQDVPPSYESLYNNGDIHQDVPPSYESLYENGGIYQDVLPSYESLYENGDIEQCATIVGRLCRVSVDAQSLQQRY